MRSISKSIRNYDARRLELLAVLVTLEHFQSIFQGRRVQLESDHRNLVYLRKNRQTLGQLGRFCMRLEEFNYELSYRPGKDQSVADCLSRNPMKEEIEIDETGETSAASYMIVEVTSAPKQPVEIQLAYVTVDTEEDEHEQNDEEEILNQTRNDSPTLDEIKKAQIDCEMC